MTLNFSPRTIVFFTSLPSISRSWYHSSDFTATNLDAMRRQARDLSFIKYVFGQYQEGLLRNAPDIMNIYTRSNTI